jgi:hypothetical protein
VNRSNSRSPLGIVMSRPLLDPRQNYGPSHDRGDIAWLGCTYAMNATLRQRQNIHRSRISTTLLRRKFRRLNPQDAPRRAPQFGRGKCPPRTRRIAEEGYCGISLNVKPKGQSLAGKPARRMNSSYATAKIFRGRMVATRP